MLAALVLFTVLVNPIYIASSSQEELDNLTREQKKLQQDIEDQAQKITDAQIEINTLNTTIASNQSQIDSLNSKVEAKQVDLNNQMEGFKSTLVLLQRLSNRNAMIEYLSSTNEDNFLLKFNNVVKMTTAIQSNIEAVANDIKEINSSLNSVKSYAEQNTKNQQKAEELLAEQEAIESELKAQLSKVDGDVTNLTTEISVQQAKQLEEQLAKEQAEQEAEAIEEADKDADNVEPDVVEPEVPDVVEPEVPEVVEPEVPDVVEPEVPDVVEPEVPDVVEPDNKYPADGNVNGYKSQLLAAAGISSSDLKYVDYIITKESGWNYLATNPYSGAYGLCQALPGSKMSSSGSDWATNPETQIKWCNSYALSRYGSWQASYEFWLDNNYW